MHARTIEHLAVNRTHTIMCHLNDATSKNYLIAAPACSRAVDLLNHDKTSYALQGQKAFNTARPLDRSN